MGDYKNIKNIADIKRYYLRRYAAFNLPLPQTTSANDWGILLAIAESGENLPPVIPASRVLQEYLRFTSAKTDPATLTNKDLEDLQAEVVKLRWNAEKILRMQILVPVVYPDFSDFFPITLSPRLTKLVNKLAHNYHLWDTGSVARSIVEKDAATLQSFVETDAEAREYVYSYNGGLRIRLDTTAKWTAYAKVHGAKKFGFSISMLQSDDPDESAIYTVVVYHIAMNGWDSVVAKQTIHEEEFDDWDDAKTYCEKVNQQIQTGHLDIKLY